jgi:hypothetical protein
MTIALSFLNDLWRVRIALSDLTNMNAVKVERAYLTADPPWETVRGGVALPIIAGAGQLDDYEYADATLNHYRVLPVDPPAGLLLPGASGDYASTPNHASLQITGDLDLRADVALDDYATGSSQSLITKWLDAATRSYRLRINTTGFLSLVWSTTGANFIIRTSTVPVPVVNGQRIAVRVQLDVDNGAGGHTVTFATAPSLAGPWSTLGTPVITAGTTSVAATTAAMGIGAANDGTFEVAAGEIFAAQARDGLEGTVVANPDFTVQAHGAGSFVDSTGKTWTINGNAEIIGELLETDSITPDNDGLTILKSIKYPALNRSLGVAPAFRPVQMASRTGVYNIKGRVPPIGVHDAWTSEWWTMEFVTESLAQLRDLKLCIQASKTLFVQTPPEIENECFTNPVSGMPGGYVYALNATMTQAVPGSSTTRWVLPVRIIAPPGPEIAGTLLNWETVKRLYGSWTALWASNPTWRDVWDQIMDPEDAVVL